MAAPEQGSDPVVAFRRALGRDLDHRLNTTQAVVGLVHAAVTNHGWTAKQLADECSRDLDDVVNAGAVITERLRKAATHPPTMQRTPALGPKIPFCTPECRDNQGWITDPDGNLLHRCPCRTLTKENA